MKDTWIGTSNIGIAGTGVGYKVENFSHHNFRYLYRTTTATFESQGAARSAGGGAKAPPMWRTYWG